MPQAGLRYVKFDAIIVACGEMQQMSAKNKTVDKRWITGVSKVASRYMRCDFAVCYSNVMFYKNIIKPLFFSMDPEKVHDLMTARGELLGRFAPTRALIGAMYDYKGPDISKRIGV